MITSGKIEQSIECCFFLYSTQTVSTSQTFELLHFLKNRVTRSISLLCTFGEFLAKSLKITHLNLLSNNGKGFLMDVVSRTSFMILLHHYWIILRKSIHILVYLLLQGKRSWTCFKACTFYSHITVTWVCRHSFQNKKLWKEICW